MALVARGLPNKEIAAHLRISEQAVKEQISSLLRRLGARNRAALAEIGARTAIVGDAEGNPEWLPFLFRSSPMSIVFVRGPEHLVEAANERGRQSAGGLEPVGKPLRTAYPGLSPDIATAVERAYADGAIRTLTTRREVVIAQPIPALPSRPGGVLIFWATIDEGERLAS